MIHPARYTFHAFLVLLVALVAVACGSKSSTTTSPSSVNVPFEQTDLVVGTGAQAVNGKVLTVQYAGWIYDGSRPEQKGSQFDSGTSFQFTLGAGTVIQGWDLGLLGMRAGGKRRLVVPPDLAYGSSAFGPIPPNSTLVFEVTLLAVQ